MLFCNNPFRCSGCCNQCDCSDGCEPRCCPVPGPAGPQGPTGPTGPTGATGAGIDVIRTFNPMDTYYAGELVYFNGRVYSVNTDYPTGFPGSSPDFDLVTVAGPTGATGSRPS